MEWRAKVELFEEIRREYEFGIGTVRGVARKLGVHRRQVRQALADAKPPARKQPERRGGARGADAVYPFRLATVRRRGKQRPRRIGSGSGSGRNGRNKTLLPQGLGRKREVESQHQQTYYKTERHCQQLHLQGSFSSRRYAPGEHG